MNKYEIAFHRYFAGGSLHFTYPVDEADVEKHAGLLTSSTSRFHVWNDKHSKLFLQIDGKPHVMTELFRDEDFIKKMKNWITSNEPGQYSKFHKSWCRHAANFFCSFTNTEDGKVRKKIRSTTPNTPKAPREKKTNVEKERKLSYRQRKSKLKNKMVLLKTMFDWKDEYPYQDGDVRMGTGAYNVYIAHKEFLEEGLRSRNIKFFVSATNVVKEKKTTSWPYFYTDYILLDNHTNAPEDVLSKHYFNRMSLCWHINQKITKGIDRYYTRRYNFLTWRNIGLVQGTGHRANKTGTQSLSRMLESRFEKMITAVYTSNNQIYNDKLKEFGGINARKEHNDKEEQKLREFLQTHIISKLDKKYIENPQCNFGEESFRVVMNKDSYSSRDKWYVLTIGTSRDNLQDMDIHVGFLHSRDMIFKTADKVIAAIKKVFGKDISTFTNVYCRAKELDIK